MKRCARCLDAGARNSMLLALEHNGYQPFLLRTVAEQFINARRKRDATGTDGAGERAA